MKAKGPGETEATTPTRNKPQSIYLQYNIVWEFIPYPEH